MNTKLYVGNLSFKISEQELQELFAPYGEVKSTKIIMDKMSGRSRGFGFVEMDSDDDAKEAIDKLDGKDSQGRALKVNIAKDREAGAQRAPRDNFNR
ncbi:MAG: RNA-binding protein [Bacteriovoracaceae bacterium]|jgi:cold-inducible RNA-binding protein|nr:RNA-binding protein [Bacteriovoracaceae bacterium]